MKKRKMEKIASRASKLNFEVEKNFKAKMNNSQLRMFYHLSSQFTVIITFLLISRKIHESEVAWDYLSLFSSILLTIFVNIIFYFAKRRIKRHTLKIICLYVLSSSVILIEGIKGSMENNQAPEVFSAGLLISLLFSFCFLSRMTTVYSLIIVITINILIFVRIETLILGQHWDVCILSVYLSFFYLYASKKLNQDILDGTNELLQTQKSLIWQRHLLEKIIPSPVLVLDLEIKKVLLANRACGSLLQIYADDADWRFKFRDFEGLVQRDVLENEGPSGGRKIIDMLKEEDFQKEEFKKFKVLFSKKSEQKLETETKSFGDIFELQIGLFEEIFQEPKVWVLIFTDISQQEKIKQLTAFDQQKDQILASVSHDLRTPINSIISLLELILDRLDPGEKKIKKYLALSINSAQSLLFLVNDLLDSSQISKGKLKNLNFESISLKSLIEPVLRLLKFPAKKKQVKLTCSYSGIEAILVSVDKFRFQQILFNLVGNALKFTDEGGYVKVELESSLKNEKYGLENDHKVATTQCFSESSPLQSFCKLNRPTTYEQIFSNQAHIEDREPADPHVLVKVIDSGIGIKKEDIPKLFTAFGKFERARNTTGVGLGLSISQRLAQMHFPDSNEGGIKVRSIYGEGSSFWFPVRIAEDRALIEDDLFEEDGSQCLSPYHLMQIYKPQKDSKGGGGLLREIRPGIKSILLVDDDQINLMILKKMIQKLGSFKMETAVNGFDALSKIQKTKLKNEFFDMIIMDNNMPNCNGLEAAAEIKQLIDKDQLPYVPIYILSADEELTESDFKFGVKQFLRKPLSLYNMQKLLGLNYKD